VLLLRQLRLLEPLLLVLQLLLLGQELLQLLVLLLEQRLLLWHHMLLEQERQDRLRLRSSFLSPRLNENVSITPTFYLYIEFIE
jgi:hypothetical protein